MLLRPLAMLLTIATPLLAISAQAQAQAAVAAPAILTRASDIHAVLTGARPAADVFAPSFLAEIPAEQLTALVAQLSAEHGKLEGFEAVKPLSASIVSFSLRFERANAAVVFEVEPAAPHRIAGLRITGVAPRDDGPARVLADFVALPGASTLGLFRLDSAGVTPILTHAPSQQRAIGSTFKLWVLDAVAQAVADKRLRWDQVVQLGLRSAPSGITQDWPAEAPVTVETLATLMISRSDNTATDTLMRLAGQDQIAARVRASGHADAARMLPMLTTLEAFTIKSDPVLTREYAAATEPGQAALLARIAPGLDAAKLNPAAFASGRPAAIETIEWFASPEDIAGVLNHLRQRQDPRVLAILGVNPALAPDQRARFARIGYKGGSEPGVINMSYVLQNQAGTWFVATASWNDPEKPVDDARFAQLMTRLVQQVP